VGQHGDVAGLRSGHHAGLRRYRRDVAVGVRRRVVRSHLRYQYRLAEQARSAPQVAAAASSGECSSSMVTPAIMPEIVPPDAAVRDRRPGLSRSRSCGQRLPQAGTGSRPQEGAHKARRGRVGLRNVGRCEPPVGIDRRPAHARSPHPLLRAYVARERPLAVPMSRSYPLLGRRLVRSPLAPVHALWARRSPRLAAGQGTSLVCRRRAPGHRTPAIVGCQPANPCSPGPLRVRDSIQDDATRTQRVQRSDRRPRHLAKVVCRTARTRTVTCTSQRAGITVSASEAMSSTSARKGP